jgi:hypothetical protein
MPVTDSAAHPERRLKTILSSGPAQDGLRRWLLMKESRYTPNQVVLFSDPTGRAPRFSGQDELPHQTPSRLSSGDVK